jgi:hypothetical protein
MSALSGLIGPVADEESRGTHVNSDATVTAVLEKPAMSRFWPLAILPTLVVAACYLPAGSSAGGTTYSAAPAPPATGQSPSNAPGASPPSGYVGSSDEGYGSGHGEGYGSGYGEGYGSGYGQDDRGDWRRSHSPWQRKECKSAYGTTVCGYHCVAEYGEVRCAATPMGACITSYGQVVCWDPEPEVAQAYGRRGPPGQCIAEYGSVACGYNCVASYGQLRCARTPDDICQANYGQIQCTDD